MASIIIKIVDKNQPLLVAQAEGELTGAGYSVVSRREVDSLGVDAFKHGGQQQTYRSAVILVGER